MFIQIGIFLKDNLAHPLFFFPETTTTCLTYFYLIFHPWALLIEFPVWKMNILLFFSFSPTLTIPSAHLISTLPSSKDIMVMLSFWIDKIFQLSSFRSLSHVRLFVTPWTAALQASLSITNSQSLLKLWPLSRWCHPTISSSVVPSSSCLQPFPASWSFPVSQFFAPCSQSIGVSASASVLPINIQDWFL